MTGESDELIRGCQRLGVDPAKTHVIRRGVNLEQFDIWESRQQVRQRLGLASAKVVLSPRNLESLYNIETVIRAIPQVLQTVDDVTFVFVWVAGGMRNELEQLAKDTGVWDVTRFVGTVNYGLIPLYHYASDVMVSVSLYVGAASSGRGYGCWGCACG